MKQKKCPYCNEKVYTVLRVGELLKYAEAVEPYIEIPIKGGKFARQGTGKYEWVKHTCKVPKRLKK